MAAIAPQTDIQTCFHCGEDCVSEPIVFDEKEFCCEGCKVVYELLDASNMCNYYNLSDQPGISIKQDIPEGRFAYLQNIAVQAELLEFQNDKISKITFHIPQMHCSSCIWLLENLYKLDSHVVESRVNFLKKELQLTYNHKRTTLEQVVKLLAHIGYEPAISLADLNAPRQKKDYSGYYKLGLAGFCFGNIMLLSFPEYLAVTGELQKEFGDLFGYLNLVLSIPVLLYSAKDFFTSAWQGLKQRMINIDFPIAVGLMALFFVSLHDILTGSGPGYYDSFTGLVFFMLIGKSFQKHTYESLSFERDYKSYFPISVTVLARGVESPVAVKELKKGQRILIRNQELIPADAILMKGSASIDYSFVSGESEPVEKVLGEIIYAGGRQVGESIELEVVKEVSQGYLTQLWNNAVFEKNEKKSLGDYANKIAKYFVAVTLLVAIGGVLYWYPKDPDMAIRAFTSVLIIACPCALSLSTPFTLGNTLRIFGKNKFYLKNTSVVEALAKADTVVFDKTGTLTQPAQSEVKFNGQALSSIEKQYLKSVLKHSTHPLSLRIYQRLEGITLPVQGFEENTGAGIRGIVCDVELRVGSAAFTGAETAPGGSSNSLQTRVYIRFGEDVKGYFTFGNVYRSGIDEVVFELKKEKKLAVLSGDNDSERERLQHILGPEADLNFSQTPVKKLEYIKHLKEQSHGVIMVGDGLNDAGALKQSDAGIALTDNVSGFSPGCDAILDAAKFDKLSLFIRFSKVSMKIIIASFVVSFFYNIIGLTLAVRGEFSPIVSAILMPISTLSVITFATVAVRVAAKRMGLSEYVQEEE